MKHLVVLVCLLAFVYGSDNDYFRRLDAIRPEDPCNRAGGICTFAADCPELTEESGLCPAQRSQGIECCYGLSNKETRCERRGGQCVPSSQTCGSVFDKATDCASGQKCCILV